MKQIVGIIMLLFLVFVSCSKTNQSNYLQKGQINLVQPRATFANSLIDSFVMLNVDLKIKGVEIYYTDNSQEPTMSSIKYSKPLKISTPGTYKFRAFHGDWKPSESTTVTFYNKGQRPAQIIWSSKENQQYKGVGKTTLINQQKASLDYSNPQWMGFDSIVNAEVIFDKLTFIKSVDIGYLNDPASWIFPPDHLELILRENGKDIEKVQLKIDPITSMEDRAMKNIHLKIDRKVTSVQLQLTNLQSIPNWHDGKGKKAWLFMDEWIFN